MTIRLYLDEDVDVALASALRQRGIDVLTTQEAGHLGLPDADQLTFAAQAGRAFFTHNRGSLAPESNEAASFGERVLFDAAPPSPYNRCEELARWQPIAWC